MNVFPLLHRLFLFTFLLGSLALTTRAADVDAVNSSLKRAEANLQMVDGSIGHLTAPPKGAAGKLSRTRLDSAVPDLAAAARVIATLKDSDAGAAEAKARYAAADALYKKLDGVLKGSPPPAPQPVLAGKPSPTSKPAPQPGSAPTPAPPTQAPATTATIKLGYPHADNFKNTLFTLNRVEQDTNGLMKLMAELQPLADQLTANHRIVAGAVDKTIETQRQAGFVHNGFAKIPANGEGVAEARQRLADADASLAAAAAYFKPLHVKLSELIDPARYPALQADLKRASELERAFRNPEDLFRDRRDAAAEMYRQNEAALAECQRIAKAYARLIAQDTEYGRLVKGNCDHLQEARVKFLAVAAAQRAALPAEIRADGAEVRRIANEAVANQKPMWFTGAIPQQLTLIDEKLALLKALGGDAGAQTASEVASLKKGLAESADTLKALIIRENPLPEDRFEGPDRKAAIAVAIDGWKHQQKDVEVLAVRIPAESWSRETKHTYSNGSWYFVDVSSLQVRLIVADKANPELAIDRPVNVRKDHQKGDALIGVPLWDFKDELQPSSYLMRNKVK